MLSRSKYEVLTVTATTDAETIGDNKVIAQSIEVPGVFSTNRGRGLLKSIVVIDEVATGPAIDILFSSADDAITQDEGKAIGEDMDDLDVVFRNFLGHVSIAASDYTDLFDAKMATKTNIDLCLLGAPSSQSIYLHIVNRSGANWVATATTNMKVRLGILKF